MFSCCTRPYFSIHCTCPCNNIPLNHDQTCWWSIPLIYKQNSILTNYLCLMFIILECVTTHCSVHQFRLVAPNGKCEIMMDIILCILDLYLNWVALPLNMANTFNLMSNGVMFQKNYVACRDIVQFIHFVHTFLCVWDSFI